MITVTTFCKDCAHLAGEICKHPESEVAGPMYMVTGSGDATGFREAAWMRAHEPTTAVHPEGTPRWCGPGAELFEAKDAGETQPEAPAEPVAPEEPGPEQPEEAPAASEQPAAA